MFRAERNHLHTSGNIPPSVGSDPTMGRSAVLFGFALGPINQGSCSSGKLGRNRQSTKSLFGAEPLSQYGLLEVNMEVKSFRQVCHRIIACAMPNAISASQEVHSVTDRSPTRQCFDCLLCSRAPRPCAQTRTWMRLKQMWAIAVPQADSRATKGMVWRMHGS